MVCCFLLLWLYCVYLQPSRTGFSMKIKLFITISLFTFTFSLCAGCAQPITSKVPPPPVTELTQRLNEQGLASSPRLVVVSSHTQTLAIYENQQKIKEYTISTSIKGLGELNNSFKTPRGFHRITDKIGAGVPNYGIFKNRQFIGEIWQPRPRAAHRKDYITTRILRLEGLEPGINQGFDRFGRVIDTKERSVYIHGTTAEWQLGKPTTRGCIHMSADDIRSLFEEIPSGTVVWIS